MKLEARDNRTQLLGEHHVISLSSLLNAVDTPNAPKHPATNFVVNLCDRKNERAVEVISSGVMFLPALPLFHIAGENMKRLNNAIPPRKMNFESGWIGRFPKVGKHEFTLHLLAL